MKSQQQAMLFEVFQQYRYASNQLLVQARQDRGWSQGDVANKIHAAAPEMGVNGISVSGPEVGRWERGERWPQPHYVRLLCHVFNATPRELGLVKRRDFLRKGAGLLAATPVLPNLEPWERLLLALERPSAVDPELVVELEAQTRSLHEIEMSLPARQVFGRLAAHLDRLSELLGGSIDPALRRRLIVTAGESAALGGWLAWDMGDRVTSSRLYETAHAAAREAEDPALRACVLAYLSYDAGTPGEARELLQQARLYVDDRLYPTTATWIDCRMAEECAALGELGTARRRLDRGLRSYEMGKAEFERAWTAFMDRNRLATFTISTYGRLGDPDEAMRVAADVVGEGLERGKWRALSLACMAEAQLRNGNVETAVDFAHQALDAAVEVESSVAMNRLRQLCRLDQWPSLSQAQDLESRLLEVTL